MQLILCFVQCSMRQVAKIRKEFGEAIRAGFDGAVYMAFASAVAIRIGHEISARHG